jgi:HEAT repeat protein
MIARSDTMKTLGRLTSIIGALMLAASLALGHGGSYGGPGGGGTSGGFNPGGEGTPTPGGQPNGGTTPGGNGPGGRGTTGPGGGGGGGGGGPTGPGGGGGAGGGLGGGVGGTLSGTTGGMRKKAETGVNLTWEAWWFFNDDRFLELKAKVRATAAETENNDLFLGEDDSAVVIDRIPARKIREQIIPKLRQAIADDFFDVRAAAVIALGKCGMADAQTDIEGLLDDPNFRVRESAALALGILGEKDALPLLIQIMEDAPKARLRLGRQQAEIFPRTRAFAAISIGLIGARHGGLDASKALDALRRMIEKRQGKAHVDLEIGPIMALGLMKSRASVPMLIAVLKDKNRNALARAYAATALGKIADPSARDALARALDDKQTQVKRSAMVALGSVIDDGDEKFNRLLRRKVKSDSDRAVRNLGVMSLAQIGGEDNRNFIYGMMKGVVMERSFAALGLGVYFHENPGDLTRRDTAEKIHKAFRAAGSPDEFGAYALALSLMKHAAAAPSIEKRLLKGGSAEVRAHLCTALGLLDYKEAIPVVREIVAEKGSVDLRRNAAIALGLLGDRSAVPFLEKEMRNSENSLGVLGAVTQGLGFIGDMSAVPTLGTMVTEDDGDNARAFAAVALGLLGDKDEIPILSHIGANENYFARSDAVSEILTIL